jgi:CRP-like cAMP-binding protein
MILNFSQPELDPDQEAHLPSVLWQREGGLDASTRESLNQALRAAQISAGSKLWLPGEELHDEMVLLSGTARMFLVDARGREWNTHLLVAPCFFPPLHLRTRGGRARQRAIAQSECRIQRIDSTVFCKLREGVASLLRLGARLVDEEMERLRSREEALLGMDLPGRVDLLLRDRPEIWQAFRRKDIASYLHATPEALSRALPVSLERSAPNTPPTA